MKTILPTSIALTILALSIFAGAPVSANNDMVIVGSTDPAFVPGAIVDGGAPLTLAADQTITLIGADGAVVTLNGPFEQAPVSVVNRTQPGDPGLVVALGALLTERENSTAVLGVVRSATATAEIEPLPDPWAVNVDRSGTRCMRPDLVTFWRMDATAAADLRISAPRSGRSAEVNWPAGTNQLAVDGAAFRDRQTYMLSLDGHEVALTMHVLPNAVGGLAEQAAWMAEAGCEAQALALLDSVR